MLVAQIGFEPETFNIFITNSNENTSLLFIPNHILTTVPLSTKYSVWKWVKL